MRATFLALAAAAGLLVSAGASQAASKAPVGPTLPAPPVCDRTCLEGFIDTYIDALVAKDPAKLPLTKDVRFTENGQTLKLGDGLWATVESKGDYKITFVDPDTAEAGAYFTVQESGRRTLVALRLHIQSATKISQIETLVSRSAPGQSPFGNAAPPSTTPNPTFFADVPEKQRMGRAQMMAIVDSYFEGLEHATDKLTPFDPNCQRRENFMVTAGNPQGASDMMKMSCGAQFATGFSPFITSVRERRYPIMDTQKGLGFAIIFFDHAGTVKTVKMTDGSTMTVPPPFDAPYSFEIFELFKVEDGMIKRVEAVLDTVPYHMTSGW